MGKLRWRPNFQLPFNVIKCHNCIRFRVSVCCVRRKHWTWPRTRNRMQTTNFKVITVCLHIISTYCNVISLLSNQEEFSIYKVYHWGMFAYEQAAFKLSVWRKEMRVYMACLPANQCKSGHTCLSELYTISLDPFSKFQQSWLVTFQWTESTPHCHVIGIQNMPHAFSYGHKYRWYIFLSYLFWNVRDALNSVTFITVLKCWSFYWNCTPVLHQGWPNVINREFKCWSFLMWQQDPNNSTSLHTDSWLEKHQIRI
jgi:hypothetical protein